MDTSTLLILLASLLIIIGTIFQVLATLQSRSLAALRARLFYIDYESQTRHRRR